mmetsp:Transcript_9694/g.8541  ORF Transcript_9694/g.8541 Transcript_9694/m.8541 type:complete len:93 (+) Transcript_9694:480-758(+)
MHLDHPKFGDIMSVVAIKEIQKDEEIVVNYGYAKHARGPKWFRDERKRWNKKNAIKEKKVKTTVKKLDSIKREAKEAGSSTSKTSHKRRRFC